MKQFAILVVLLFSSLSLFSQTQSEMYREMYIEYQETNEKLDSIYELVLNEYKDDTTFTDKLVISQNIWKE